MTIYTIATAPGGLATQPATSSGTLQKMKLHICSVLRLRANISRSKLSPIGQPHPLKSTSWRLNPKSFSRGLGHASYATVSLATAANAFFQCHSIISLLASTPTLDLTGLCGDCAFCPVVKSENADNHPVRISRISPGWKVSRWADATANNSESGIL